MRWALSWILLLFCCAFAAAQADLSVDKRLDKTVSLRAPVLSLADTTLTLSKASGVALVTTINVSDRKICAYFEDRPLRDVMTKLATLFDGQWVFENNYYRFEVPNKISQLEKDLISKEDAARRAFAEARVKKWIEGTRQGSYSELTDQATKLHDQVKAIKNDLTPEGKAKRDQLSKQAEDLDEKLNGYAAGCVLGKLDTRGMDAFWHGTAAYGSTDPNDGVTVLPKEVETGKMQMNTEHGLVSSTAVVVLVRYSPLKGDLEFQQQMVFDTEEGGGKMMMRLPSPDEDIDNQFSDHPFRVMAKKWATSMDDPKAQSILDTPLSETGRQKDLKSPYLNKTISLSEQLEWLHDATGLPIIAETFRHPIGIQVALKASPKLRNWLSAFMANSPTSFHGYVRIEDGWVSFRHPSFWRQRLDETPEKYIVPLEKKVADGKPLTVDDYGALASRLNDLQLFAYSGFENYWSVTATFDTTPLSDAGLALRLWGLLDASQKQRARSEAGLGATEMIGTQQAQYWDVVRDSLWSQIITQRRLRSALVRGSDPELEKQMRFFFSENQDVFLMQREFPTPKVGADGSPEPMNDFSTTRFKGVKFVFGQTREKGASFACSFDRTVK